MEKFIEVKGARVNNLKDISLKIPRDKLIVITGISGSGKSSLAFDTLYAEGQRRYVESLSSYARQYLGRMSKPECDYIKGLPPAIAVEQKVISRNPRSTIGTSTEIYEYLRLLFARIGHTYSPVSGKEVKTHTVDDVLECTRQYSEGTKFAVLAPLNVVQGRTLHEQLTAELQQGYSRIWYKGEFVRIDDFIAEDKENVSADQLYVLIDRMSVSSSESNGSRLTESVETAFYEGNGTCRLVFPPSNICYDFSTSFEEDGITFEKPTDSMFAFNSPAGACPECEGFGKVIGIDEKLVVPNTSLSVYDGCVQCWHGEKLGTWKAEFCRRAATDKFPIFEPYFNLTRAQKDMLWHGLPSDRNRDVRDRVCIDSFFQMVKENQYKIQYRVLQSRYRGKTVCPLCYGTRLKKEATWVKIGGMSITELVEMPVVNLKEWFANLQLSEHEAKIAKRLLTEINNRLQFLLDVGLGYLTLNRPSDSLSGGESQRIRLATQIGSSLTGVLYILDEPSIGLHQRDNDKLIATLRRLRDLGNTLIVVEHDEDTMCAADWIVDIGPGAGVHGGEVIYSGEVSGLLKCKNSITGQYLSGKLKIPVPEKRRKPSDKWLHVIGAAENNLRNINVDVPLGIFTCVTGVSGSGKSSLVNEIIYKHLVAKLNRARTRPGRFTDMTGSEYLDKVIMIDQSPIGRTPRSNPATYTGVFNDIRDLFSQTNEAKAKGYGPGRFSFNIKGGRCEACEGDGIIKIEMHFLPDVFVPCEVCKGHRYNRETLEVRYKGKNIFEVLDMTVSEGVEFFANIPKIYNKLKTLEEVGLGYIKIGQSSTTLSGGEAQRIKLAAELAKRSTGKTIYILDEPTTGLHTADVRKLIEILQKLTDGGNTVLVIEHNLDVIKTADYLIDMGPEGGSGGGTVIASGTPEEVAANPVSYTGAYLKKLL